jgi:hypothetical protein
MAVACVELIVSVAIGTRDHMILQVHHENAPMKIHDGDTMDGIFVESSGGLNIESSFARVISRLQ